MSEKVTFQELIESIAEETDNSKQFTHDFLKDFVDVINSGLENDGNVNIAGLGKFELRHVDEREGYNPQTEERMTIPAHNRIVFKPYKDLRELVNAPYAHLEPELIKEEFQSARKEEDTEDTDASDQEDFIPTAPPTSHKPEESSESEEDTEEQEEAPFDLDEPNTEMSSSFSFEEEEIDDEGEEDIVEFSGEAADDDEIDDDLSDFFGTDDSDNTSEEEPDEEKIEETVDETADDKKEAEEPSPYAPEYQASEDEQKEADKEESATPAATTPSFDSHQRSRKNNSAVPIIAAAMVILILVAGGAWYLGFFGNNAEQPTTNQAVSTAQAPSAADTQTDSQTSGNDQADATANDQQSQAQQANQAQDNQAQQAAQTQSNQAQQASQAGQNQQADQAAQNDRESLELTIPEGETLWSIANNQYRDSQLWPWIYDNNESIHNPNVIHAGNTLSVPLPSRSRYELSGSDSVAVAKGYIATYRWYKDNGSSVAKNYLWVAKTYHGDLSDITEVQIDKDDLAFANTAR